MEPLKTVEYEDDNQAILCVFDVVIKQILIAMFHVHCSLDYLKSHLSLTVVFQFYSFMYLTVN